MFTRMAEQKKRFVTQWRIIILKSWTMIPLSPHHINLLLKCDQINDVLGFWRPQAHVHQRRLSFETSTSSKVENTWISYLLLPNCIFSARSWVPRTLPTSLSWRSGTATPAFPRPSSRPALCRAEVCLSVYLYTEIWLLFVLFLHYICLVFVCTDLFDYLLRRSPPTSTKHPSRQADVCPAEQKPDRQGDTFSQFFSYLSQMAKFVLIISQITSWLILWHSSFLHI